MIFFNCQYHDSSYVPHPVFRRHSYCRRDIPTRTSLVGLHNENSQFGSSCCQFPENNNHDQITFTLRTSFIYIHIDLAINNVLL